MRTRRRQPREVRRRAASGVTLIELLVVVSVVGILTMLALPSFSSAFLSNRLASYSNSFTSSAQLARSEAIKRNTVVSICRSTTGTACASSGTFQQGWMVYYMDGTAVRVLQHQEALNSAYSVTTTGGTYQLDFPPGGVGTSYRLKICRQSPAGEQERQIDITATGRAAVTTTRTGSCP